MSTTDTTVQLPHGPATVVALLVAALRELAGLNYRARAEAACRAIVAGGSVDEGLELMAEIDDMLDAVAAVLADMSTPDTKGAEDGLNAIVYSVVGVDDLDHVLNYFDPRRTARSIEIVDDMMAAATTDAERDQLAEMLVQDEVDAIEERALLAEVWS